MSGARLGLTPRQRDCLHAIIRHIADHGCAPSYDDLRQALGIRSKGNIVRLVTALAERGWITHQPHVARSIAIVAPPEAGYGLPAALDAKLRAHCIAHDEAAADVVADAVALLLDSFEVAEVAA